MVLIVTQTEDYTADYLARILNEQEKPFLRLNTDLLASLPFEIRLGSTDSTQINNHSSFTGLWFRRVQLPLTSNYESDVNRFVAYDYESLLFNLVTTLNVANVLSDPYKIHKAENKMYQLRMAKAVGFTIPEHW